MPVVQKVHKVKYVHEKLLAQFLLYLKINVNTTTFDII